MSDHDRNLSDDATPDMRLWVWAVLALVLTLMAAAMRFYNLGEYGLWVDELISIKRVCGNMLEYNHRLVGYLPILFVLEIKGVDTASMISHESWAWAGAGVTAFSARLGPALVGIVSVPLLILAAKPVVGRRASLIFGLLLVVAVWHLYWSQNARFYTPLFLFSCLALLLYMDATRQRSNWKFALAMVCLGLGFTSHPTGAFMGIAMAGDWLVGLARRKRVWIGPVGWTVVGLCVVYFVYWCYMFATGHGLRTMKEQGNSYSQASLILGFVFMAQPVVVLVAGLGAWLSIRESKREGWALMLGAITPLAILLIASFVSYAHFRYAFVGLGPVLVIAAVGLDRLYEVLRPRAGFMAAGCPAALVVVACLLACFYYYRGGEGFRLRWDDAFAYVERHAKPGDVIYTDYLLGGEYYLKRSDLHFLRPDLDLLTEVDRPAWFVVMSETASSVSLAEPALRRHAELKAYFDTRIEQPFSSIKIYRYVPSTAKGFEPEPLP